MTTLQIGVKLLVRDSHNQYLLLGRSEEYLLDSAVARSWDIPGGRIAPDEPLLSALQRELREEIGTDLGLETMPQLLAAQDIFVPTKALHVVRLTYLLPVEVAPAITLSEEHAAYQWFSAADLAGLEIEPYLRQVLDTIVGAA